MTATARAAIRAILDAHYEQGAIGPELFPAACKMGVEGIVSKHLERQLSAAHLWLGEDQESGTPGLRPRALTLLSVAQVR